jgi:hypothetical protein
MQICLQLLGQTMALEMEQLLLTCPTTTTIGLSAHRPLFQPLRTMKACRQVGKLLLGFSFTIHLAIQRMALTHLTQQA